MFPTQEDPSEKQKCQGFSVSLLLGTEVKVVFNFKIFFLDCWQA